MPRKTNQARQGAGEKIVFNFSEDQLKGLIRAVLAEAAGITTMPVLDPAPALAPAGPGELLDLNATARYVRRSRGDVYKLMKFHGLPAIRVGARWRFRKGDIDAWVASQPAVNKAR